MDGQADHVEVVALDAGDEGAAQSLDAVPARLIPAGGGGGGGDVRGAQSGGGYYLSIDRSGGGYWYYCQQRERMTHAHFFSW